MSRKAIAPEAILDLRRQLGTLPPRSAERRRLIQETAAFYGVSEPTLYRLLRQRRHPRSLGRADRGSPRVLPKAELERYLELIAALKVRTSNGKGRHLSTREAIRVLENYGVDTTTGRVQAPKGLLKTPTVNAYLKAWGLDWRHWFSVMGMAKCRRLAGKPSACGYIIIDSIHHQMRSMTWNCYRSSAQHATLLSCNLIRRIPPSIMVAVSFTNVRTVLPTFLRQKRLSWQA